MWTASGAGSNHLLPILGLHLTTPQATGRACKWVAFLSHMSSCPTHGLTPLRYFVHSSSSEKHTGTPAVPGAGPCGLEVQATRASGHHSRGLCVISWRP